MPSVSKSQQRLFGLVRKCQETGKCISPKIKKIASRIDEKDAKDFAKTKHKKLPEKIKKKKSKKIVKKFSEWIQTNHPEFNESLLGVLGSVALGAAAVAKTAIKGRKNRGYGYDKNSFDKNYGTQTYRYTDNFLNIPWNWDKLLIDNVIVFFYFYPKGNEELKDNEFTAVTAMELSAFEKSEISELNKKTNKRLTLNEKINYLKNTKNYWDDEKIRRFYESIKRRGMKPEDFNGKDIRI